MRIIKTLLFLILINSTTSVTSQTKLPAFFSSNMVFQQNEKVAVWGEDKPNVTIKIIGSWGEESVVKSNQNGTWKLKIQTPKAGGPYTVTIKGSDEIVLNNILIGEVWLCSGQSNMDMAVIGFKNQPINGSNEAILNATNSQIRLFEVKRNTSTSPLDDVSGSWNMAQPKTVKSFSATAYFFAKKLQQTLNVPIGVIQSSWGGTPIESWTDLATVSKIKAIKPINSNTNIKPQKVVSSLYNAMIHPFAGYSIKGVIWYQGESNRSRAAEYKLLFPAMIKSWRANWNQGEFPFYFVQIAPFGYGDEFSPYLREAQLYTMQQVENTGMAVTLDIGDCNYIHPREKKLVGERLAYWALARNYDFKEIGFSGPLYKKMEKTPNGKISVYFDFATNGLSSFGKELTGFEIAGEDKVFVPAKAKIMKDTSLMVWSDEIKKPIAVRYAFYNCIKGTLFNVEGLPASSFRTDDWEIEEEIKTLK